MKRRFARSYQRANHAWPQCALKRLWRGRVREQKPSPFLAAIESELVKQQQAQRRRKRDDRQLKLF